MYEKVTVFITRKGVEGPELLLLQHPHDGLHLPAGTVEEGETQRDAALREATENTGLEALTVKRCIGAVDVCTPAPEHIVIAKTRVYSRPDKTSLDWARLKRGVSVSAHREEEGFTLVTYAEMDEDATPPYLTYQITGWVPSVTLADRQRRYLYHLTCRVKSSRKLTQLPDNQWFGPFWAPLSDLPPLVDRHQQWLDYAVGELGYRFE